MGLDVIGMQLDQAGDQEIASEVFGLFRSWHNERALDPDGPWRRLTLAIAYATEAHLFITDVNQSPFNVGTRLTLEEFTFEQVEDLNQRHGSPLCHRERLGHELSPIATGPVGVDDRRMTAAMGWNEEVGEDPFSTRAGERDVLRLDLSAAGGA